MKKSGFMRILLLAGSVLILVGVALMTWMVMTAEDRTVINLELEPNGTYELSVEELCLIPGEEVAYTIKLNSNKADRYDLRLDFEELEEKTLKNYARVKIASGDKILYDELLATAFDEENLAFPVDFEKEINTEFILVYYLPIDVGNEAENAQAVFDLQITASNE